MSRIICTRHPNGEEQLVVGWDRPINAPFAHIYSDEGEIKKSVDFASLSVIEIFISQLVHGQLKEMAMELLDEHSKLDYPASNIVVDLTRPA
jgi:hypothetical protein